MFRNKKWDVKPPPTQVKYTVHMLQLHFYNQVKVLTLMNQQGICSSICILTMMFIIIYICSRTLSTKLYNTTQFLLCIIVAFLVGICAVVWGALHHYHNIDVKLCNSKCCVGVRSLRRDWEVKPDMDFGDRKVEPGSRFNVSRRFWFALKKNGKHCIFIEASYLVWWQP